MPSGEFEKEFKANLRGARKVVVLAVGDELDPRDCVGNYAGRHIAALKLRNVEVLLTSQMPENFTSVVRRLEPSHVVIVDAAEMDGKAGDVMFIEPGKVVATRVSTHAMPLSVLMEYLEKELKVKVALIGIQPGGFDEISWKGPSEAVRKGVDKVVSGFKDTFGGPYPRRKTREPSSRSSAGH